MPYPTWSGLNPSSDIGPQSKQTYEPWIQASATQHGLDPRLIHAVIQAESAYNPFAVSNKGAQGLMQLMPSTADRFGVVNPMDAGENIAGGAQYLKTLLNQFDSDLELALAAYNAGENNVIRYGKKVPPFSETQKYVQKVLEIYQGR
jgi:soluble lytic murein transglycosylase-like protein